MDDMESVEVLFYMCCLGLKAKLFGLGLSLEARGIGLGLATKGIGLALGLVPCCFANITAVFDLLVPEVVQNPTFFEPKKINLLIHYGFLTCNRLRI